MCLEYGSSENKIHYLSLPRGLERSFRGLEWACSALFWPGSELASFLVCTGSTVLSGLLAARACSLCCFRPLISEMFFQNTILSNAAWPKAISTAREAQIPVPRCYHLSLPLPTQCAVLWMPRAPCRPPICGGPHCLYC